MPDDPLDVRGVAGGKVSLRRNTTPLAGVAVKAQNTAALMRENVELRDQLDKAKKALLWYADERTWNQWLPDHAGERARDALKEITRA